MKVNPLKSGFKGDGESGYSWWLFSSDVTNEQIKDWCEENYVLPHSGAPGQSFAYKPIIRRRGISYVLLTQFGGLDI